MTPEIVGPTKTRNAGIIGEEVDLNLDRLGSFRLQKVEYFLTHYMLTRHWREPNEDPRLHLFGQMKRIVQKWMDECFECKAGTYPAHLHVS